MKSTYQKIETTIICLQNEDVITLSSGSVGEITNKKIVKTKIISTSEQETEESRKKGKTSTVLAGALFGGLGAWMQDGYNKRNQETEQVVTFLVIYDDGSRETLDAVKDSETYKKLIMYIE